MLKFLKFTVGIAILAAWVAPVHSAEKVTLVPEEGTVEIMLLRQKSVREELKLPAATAEKIHKYAAEQWKKAQDVVQLPAKEQDAKFAAMEKENEKFLEQTLNAQQRKRLNEITLQIAGLLYVTRKDIASQLKLTPEQTEQARKYQKEAKAEIEQVIESSKYEQRKEKFAELSKTSHKRLFDLLTDEQEVTWKKLTGTPFKGEFEYASSRAAAGG
jgi:protease II